MNIIYKLLVTFKLSGNSDRPAYPGFMVIATKQLGFRVRVVPSNSNVSTWSWTALWMDKICCATTDNTSNSILLNSSKQAHAPELANPLKN